MIAEDELGAAAAEADGWDDDLQVVVSRIIPIAAIVPHPRNYNKHPEGQLQRLEASDARFGQVKSIVVQQGAPGVYMLVAGEGYLTARRRRGKQYVRADVIPADWSALQVEGYLLADNELARLSEPNPLTLAELLQEQANAQQPLESVGYTGEELGDLLDRLANDYLNQDGQGGEGQPGQGEGGPEEGSPRSGPALGSLAERFGVPPFSVLDARSGYWQQRKRAWISLGIRSELGRGESSLDFSASCVGLTDPADRAAWNATRRADPKRNGHGAGTLGAIAENQADLLSPEYRERAGRKQQTEGDGLLGYSQQVRSHYGRGRKKAVTFQSQDGLNAIMHQRSPASGGPGSGRQGQHVNGLLMHSDSGNDPEYYFQKQAVEQRLGRELTTEEFQRDYYQGPTTLQSGTSIFDPVLCELVYRWFTPPDGTILDPFAGGSVRGIVAAKLGRAYHGIDLRPEQVAANDAQAQAICGAPAAGAGAAHRSTSSDVDVQLPDHTPALTPVEPHGGYAVKREDRWQQGGVNGSKVRALFKLLAGQPGVVAYGSRHSPHPNRVAHVCRRLGIPCRLHVAQGAMLPEWQQAEKAGAEIVQHKAGYMNVVRARATADAKERGWYLVPFGAVCEETAEDVAPQVANVPADGQCQRLVCAVGSGITLAGILRGLDRTGRGALPVLGICVGQDPTPVLDQYAPEGWRDHVTLVQSPLKYEDPSPVTWLGDALQLDPIYEAKCLGYLQPGDLLWVVGVRQTLLLDALRGAMPAEAREGASAGMAPCPLPQWHVGDSRDLEALLPGDLAADLVFTCPPYYDLEVYSDDQRDLSTAGSYADFLAAYEGILRAAVARLRPDRFACVVVGDVRGKDGCYRGLVSDTIGIMERAGARLYNEAILVTIAGSLPIRVGKQFAAGRKLGKTHQQVLVFVKGDWRQAVAACGDVEIVDLDALLRTDAGDEGDEGEAEEDEAEEGDDQDQDGWYTPAPGEAEAHEDDDEDADADADGE